MVLLMYFYFIYLFQLFRQTAYKLVKKNILLDKQLIINVLELVLTNKHGP